MTTELGQLPKASEMNALSLFSEIGSLDLAAEAAGIRTVSMCQVESIYEVKL